MVLPLLSHYATLPDRLYTAMAATPVPAPELVAFNDALATNLGLDPQALRPEAAELFSGNRTPEGATPLAQLYAGHQFGHWNPQLGDGRALLLGEIETPEGLRDIQLKGSGPTPYSRGGDGRAWLGPVLREYVVSEAMAALGIPTTRALAAVTTGEDVIREAPLPGAVLTRVAASHIRVGTFQILAARDDIEGLQALTDHALARHYPEASGPQGLLDAVVAAQAELIAAWMSVGFIHGVMNTDNCAISGETIDYGPCAFLDSYHPETVFSSIDRQGRYAYGNQPQIAAWNLAQLASALLPLEADREMAIEAYTASVNAFAPLYQAAWLRRFGAKIGLAAPRDQDLPLITGLLAMMAETQADFTTSFARLPEGLTLTHDNAAQWNRDWQARLRDEADPTSVMVAANPQVIARNHLIEAMIQSAVAGDYAPFHQLNATLAEPYRADAALTPPARPEERVLATFCGT